MKLREKIRNMILAPVVGLFLGLFAALSLSTPVQATSATPVETVSTIDTKSLLTTFADESDDLEEEDDSAEEENTCYDEVGAIGWLVCPTSGAIAKAVDGIYSIIKNLLAIDPVKAEDGNPVYIVWQYMRDITNIIFIIMIIVIIYSQLTGVGFDNYSIKKTLPKIIIAAVLVNLSFIICSLAVDASNLLGNGIRGFFGMVEQQVTDSAYFGDAPQIGWVQLAAALTTGVTVAGVAISATGGLGAFLPMLIVALLAAFLAIVVGLVTISLRQAVVSLLTMIAPLAFVCYLLPNTEQWFKKWKDTLLSMLIFFPMFSALFGASHLAGWALIAKASQDGSSYGLVLGMAVQVIPFFLSISLMKMSNTILGKISSKLSDLTGGINTGAQAIARDYRDTARARKLAEAAERNFNPASGASYAAWFNTRKALRAASREDNEARQKAAADEAIAASRSGRRIIGRRDDGSAIYSQRTVRNEDGTTSRVDAIKENRAMRENYSAREAKLRLSGEELYLDNAMNDIKAHLGSSIDADEREQRQRDYISDQIRARSARQAENYLNLRTQQSAKTRNDRADQRFYFDSVREAAARDEEGRIADIQAYNRLVRGGAGADVYSDDETIQQNALNTVVADAYTAYEKEREETTKRYSTLFSRQVTKDVLGEYGRALAANNIDAVIAAQNTLAQRGDHDRIGQYLRNFMDQTKDAKDDWIDFSNLGEDKRFRLTSDFANSLALNLLGMKDGDPFLARLGKSINMETWRYTTKKGTADERETDVFTFKDYVFGDKNGGHNQSRTSAAHLMKGTNITKVERTFTEDLANSFAAYGSEGQNEYTQTILNMMPQIISAMPTYESGGEVIMNIDNTVTGLKNKDGKWVRNIDKETGVAAPINTLFMEKYIKGMTDRDLNAFKTDTFEAICEAIAQSNNTTCYDEKGKFSDVVPSVVSDQLREWANKDMLNAIQNNVNQGNNAGMKPKVLRAFGIKVPAGMRFDEE